MQRTLGEHHYHCHILPLGCSFPSPHPTSPLSFSPSLLSLAFLFHSPSSLSSLSSSLSSSHRLTPASEATHSVNQLHLLLDGCSAQPSDYLKKLCRYTCTHGIQHSYASVAQSFGGCTTILGYLKSRAIVLSYCTDGGLSSLHYSS